MSVLLIFLKKRVLTIISASSDRRRMQRSSLEPPRRAASNGGGYILLQPLDINNSAINIYVTAPFAVSLNISASSGRRRMKPPPFDAARRGDSNELCCILLRPLDAEIFNENGKWRSNVNVNCRIVDVSLNISTSSGCRRMSQPPFNAA